MESNKIAEYLLKIKAVQLRLDPPFTWSSGWKSPIYCDNRLTLSYPTIRKHIKAAFVARIRSEFPQATGIAGVATGAIAHGVLVAEAMELPFVYVRAQAKGHGLGNRIEGALDTEGQYVVIEDLISTGKSSVQAVQAIQESGATVLGTLAIFNYGFPQAEATYAPTGTRFSSLTSLGELLEKAIENSYLRPEEQSTIEAWQQDPEQWQQTLS